MGGTFLSITAEDDTDTVFEVLSFDVVKSTTANEYGGDTNSVKSSIATDDQNYKNIQKNNKDVDDDSQLSNDDDDDDEDEDEDGGVSKSDSDSNSSASDSVSSGSSNDTDDHSGSSGLDSHSSSSADSNSSSGSASKSSSSSTTSSNSNSNSSMSSDSGIMSTARSVTSSVQLPDGSMMEYETLEADVHVLEDEDASDQLTVLGSELQNAFEELSR